MASEGSDLPRPRAEVREREARLCRGPGMAGRIQEESALQVIAGGEAAGGGVTRAGAGVAA